MPKITIRNRWTDAVLFEHEVTDKQQASGLAMRAALEAATKARADLSGANLSGAYLSRAYLSRADLSGADLSRAYLSRANLSGANLSGAKVRDLLLVGARPFLAIGPIGSESRTVFAWLTESGLRIQAGCFFGTRDEFTAQLAKTHNDNVHAQEYTAALVLIDTHARLWTPATEPAQAALTP